MDARILRWHALSMARGTPFSLASRVDRAITNSTGIGMVDRFLAKAFGEEGVQLTV